MPLQDIDEIIVVPQFHYDIAYLQTEEQYYPRCFNNFCQAIELMESNPDYRYTIEQPFLVEAFERRCPDDFARLLACHERGQLEVSGALYLIPDMNIPCGEALVRHVMLGKRYIASRFGVDARVAWIADTWGHAPTLPQIMRHAGIDTYMFTRGMRPELQKGDFVWVGLDGTEIVAHWLPAGYAAIRFPSDAEIENALELNMVSATVDNLTTIANSLRSANAQGTVLLCCGGDMAPPQASAPAVMREWQALGLPVRFGTIADYAKALHASEASLPRISADFNPLFVGTQASRIRLKQFNRELENALLSVEALHAAVSLAGSWKAMPSYFDRAWKICLKNQFHDTISGTVVDDAYRVAIEDYQGAFALVDGAKEQIAGEAGELAVFNPSGFERTEWVVNGNFVGLVTVPALGFSDVPTGPAQGTSVAAAPNDAVVFENEHWRLTVGPSGVITSCIDVTTKQDFVDGAWGNLAYRADNGDLWLLDQSPLNGGVIESQLTEPRTDDPFRAPSAPLINEGAVRQDRTRADRSLVTRNGVQQVTARGELSFWRNRVEFETTISLCAGDPVIHFRTVCKGEGKHYRIYTCFGTPWKDATARHSVPFGAVVRDDNRYADQNYIEAVAANGDGVRVLNAGLPGNAVNNGVVSTLLYRSASMEYKAASEDAFEDGKRLVFDYAVRPFTSARPGNAEREGERINRPLIVTRWPAGVSGAALVTVEPENVHVNAFYVTDIGELILRVHESTGTAAAGRISFGVNLAAAFVSDGLESPGSSVELDGDGFAIALRPWEIATWRLRFAS
ncbi:MAG TPA: glycosyl hydrolase-related protein [Capsulimonadaceae bacterium]